MMNGVVGGENDRASGGERQTNQTRAGNFQRGLAAGRNLNDATFAGERSGYVEIAFGIERNALRASQPAVES